MKVLWFSNIRLTDDNLNKSGTWIKSMYQGLCASRDVDIVANISFSNSDQICITKRANLKELLVPISYEQRLKDISSKIIQAISDFVEEISPDVIHVWGLESVWAGICQTKLNKYPQLIEIQGFKGITGQSMPFNAGLEKLPHNFLGYFEWLLPKYTLRQKKKDFELWDIYEQRVISHAKFISTQSNWVRDVLKFHFATKAEIFNTQIILRDSFKSPIPWSKFRESNNTDIDKSPVLFSISSPIPYKGAHISIRALYLLKKYYPNIKLRIAGISISSRNLKSSGYIRYIYNLINKLNLKDNVEFLGNLTEDVILQELYKCNVFVNPTFIETYCLALAEALSVGVPTVSSFTAAIPELVDGNNGLIVPLGDPISMASSVYRLISDPTFAMKVSLEAYSSMMNRNNSNEIIGNQIKIYKKVINQK